MAWPISLVRSTRSTERWRKDISQQHKRHRSVALSTIDVQGFLIRHNPLVFGRVRRFSLRTPLALSHKPPEPLAELPNME